MKLPWCNCGHLSASGGTHSPSSSLHEFHQSSSVRQMPAPYRILKDMKPLMQHCAPTAWSDSDGHLKKMENWCSRTRYISFSYSTSFNNTAPALPTMQFGCIKLAVTMLMEQATELQSKLASFFIPPFFFFNFQTCTLQPMVALPQVTSPEASCLCIPLHSFKGFMQLRLLVQNQDNSRPHLTAIIQLFLWVLCVRCPIIQWSSQLKNI